MVMDVVGTAMDVIRENHRADPEAIKAAENAMKEKELLKAKKEEIQDMIDAYNRFLQRLVITRSCIEGEEE